MKSEKDWKLTLFIHGAADTTTSTTVSLKNPANEARSCMFSLCPHNGQGSTRARRFLAQAVKRNLHYVHWPLTNLSHMWPNR